MARGRYSSAFAFVQGLRAGGGIAREGGGLGRIEASALARGIGRSSRWAVQGGGGGAAAGGQPAAPGIGHKGGPLLGQPPEIPKEDSGTEPLRNAVAKLAARWLARALANAEFGPAGEYLTVLEAAAETALWLYDKYPLSKPISMGQSRSKSFKIMLESLERVRRSPYCGEDARAR